MIQRIQTIFLFLAAVFMLGLLAFPMASTPSAVQGSALLDDGTYTVQDNPVLLGLFLVSGALALVAVFLFRNRILQMRLTIFSTIAGIIGAILTVLFLWQDQKVLEASASLNDGLGAYLPLLGIAALFLAYRYIGKDEKLVRSMDRLR